MPLDLPRFGVRLSQALEPRRSLELAAAAEADGFASLWFAENPFHRGLVPVAGACAAMTERISIGLGIVNFYQHHPTLIAAEFAALDELAGGPRPARYRRGHRAAGSAARLQVAPAPLAGGRGGDHQAAVAQRSGGPSRYRLLGGGGQPRISPTAAGCTDLCGIDGRPQPRSLRSNC